MVDRSSETFDARVLRIAEYITLQMQGEEWAVVMMALTIMLRAGLERARERAEAIQGVRVSPLFSEWDEMLSDMGASIDATRNAPGYYPTTH